MAAPIVEKLKTGAAIERGYLGVTIQPISEDLADSLGIPHNRGEFVQAIEPGGAAANAGIRAGDVIVRVDGKDVTHNQTLSYLIAGIGPGRRIPKIGRASCRERVGQYVEISVVAESVKKKHKDTYQQTIR